MTCENIFCFESVTSTNDVLKQMALDGAKEGTVVVAKSQTNGRGRRSKTFISKKGGLYLSILLRPKEINFDTTLITCAAAVAVSKAIEEVSGKKTGIKWVNDVFIENKKVCGILCESTVCGEQNFVIAGIGINVFDNGFCDEIKDIATAVFENEMPEVKEKLMSLVIDNFFKYYKTNCFLEEYKNRSIVLGKEVTVLNSGLNAKAVDIDGNCRLLVRYQNGEQEYLSSGDISIRLK